MEKHAGYIYYFFVHPRIYSMLFDQATQSLKKKILLQADPMLTACILAAKTKLNYSTYQTKFDTKMSKMNLHSEYHYECISNSLSSYPVLSREAGVSNQLDMASSQK